MEVGIIRQINIDNEMQASYLDYAMSVIVARALPDVRDGLKPVHRRILYAMQDLGLTSDKPYKKSARIVGEVLGKYHPHGDAAVYEAMVRMAQDFSLRYPLVDGQGNFGSVDGDNAAAMRYTEARLSSIANEMLADIDKDTVDWGDNFDGTLREPSVLPAALPNLLVNGSSGIAVGMATNIPPHNLGEVCDAACYLIDNYDRAEDVNTEDLMRFVHGPDFPTGGIVFRYEQGGPGDEAEQVDAIERAYGTGRGSLVVQAKAHIEEMSRNRSRIVVTELPYQTDKSRLVERIAELVRDGRIEGITDLRDESDRTGMRLCIEMTRTVDARQVLADLYKLTPLQSTFGVSLLALVDGEPRLLGLKKLLQHFIEHRREVILRRSRYELKKAREREHILEGLLRALDVLDEIIALIRRSRTAEAARLSLVRDFQFTDVQAQAILDMQLRRLAALERQKLQDEYKQVQKLIKELEALLASPKMVLALIKQNLMDLKARYGDARRTQIAERVKAVLTAREHIVERDVWVAIDGEGRLSVTPQGSTARPPHSSAAPRVMLAANTRQDVYLFSASGRAARIAGHQLPEGPGGRVSELSGLNDRVVAGLALSAPEPDEPAQGFLLLGTVQGKVKRIALADLFAQAHTGPQVIGLDEGDELAWAGASRGEGEILLVTASGQAIRFAEEDVRAMGLPAGGVGGIKLRENDRVVAGLVLGRAVNGESDGQESRASKAQGPEARVAIITIGGFGKQVPLTEFPPQGRNGGGVVAAKIVAKSGGLAGAALLAPGAYLVCVAPGTGSAVVAAKELPTMSRATQGKAIAALAKLKSIERVYAVKPVVSPAPAGGPDRASIAGDGSGGKSARQRAAPATLVPAEDEEAAAGKPARARRRTAEPADRDAPAASVQPEATGARVAPRTAPAARAAAQTAAKELGAAVTSPKTQGAGTAKAARPAAAKGAAGAPPAQPVRKAAPVVETGAGAATKSSKAKAGAPAKPGRAQAQPKAGAKKPVVKPGKATLEKVASRAEQPAAVARGKAAPAPGAVAKPTATRKKAGAALAPEPPKAPAAKAGNKGPAAAGSKGAGQGKGRAAHASGEQLPLVPPTDLPAAQTPQPGAWPRAKRSAADGPMTWPLVPDPEVDEGADELPRRPRSRKRPGA